MSKYTTEVRSICEVAAGLTESLGYNSINDILKQAAPNVFNFDWPIFDEAYRLPLEIKILKHFYTREIGLETVGLWKLKLDTKLNEIMPYYNQLYKSELIEFNPLYDVDITRNHTKTNDGEHKTDGGHSTENTVNDTATSESTTSGTNSQKEDTVTTTTGKNTNRYSDTPQGALTDLEANTYLTNATIVDDNNSNTIDGSVDSTSEVQYNDSSTRDNKSNSEGTSYSYSNITDTESYLEHVTGKQGTASYSKLLQEYRETFLNIDMMVIEELNDLFFGLW